MKKAGGVLLSVGLCSSLKLRFAAVGIMMNIFLDIRYKYYLCDVNGLSFVD